MFNFTPLLGAQSTSPASQSLLELDGGIKILVDVGWDESFDVEKLKELERQIPTLSVILLTHATTSHIAAFAHCCKHFPLFTRIPIYATTPVISLGRTLLQDLYSSTPLASSVIPESALSDSAYSFPALQGGKHPHILLQPPTAEEIAGYFSLINPLKYSQPHQPLPSPFSPPLNGLTITAYSAGHTLGGTIWHIQHGMESIVYAVDWNQAREHVLSGAAWFGGSGSGAEVIEQLRRPTAMVCSSRGAERVALQGGRQKRDETLIEMIKDTIRQGGSVLIPSDSSARILELAYLLENVWQSESEAFGNAGLYLASRTCGATMRYTRSMLEWMDEGIVREFEAASSGATGENTLRNKSQQGVGRSRGVREDPKAPAAPFDFKHLKLVERKAQVTRMLSSDAPRVILASDISLEWGFSKEALRALAADKRNLVVLTERVAQPSSAKKGLGRLLWELWSERSGADSSDEADSTAVHNASGAEASVEVAQAAPLEGNEVPLYQQYLAQQRQLHNTLQMDGSTNLETSADVIDDRSSTTSESSEEEDTEHQGKALNISAAMTHSRNKLGLSDAELGINILLRRKNVHDYDTRGKKGREKMFPYVAKRKRADEFGELIRPEEYLRAEERDEVEGQDMRNGNAQKEMGVGQKRKWDEQAAKNVPGKKGQLANGANKRRKGDPDAMQDGGAPADQAENEEASESEDEVEESTVSGPSKLIFSTETVRLDCRIAFVDFSGLHDKRSLQLLIPLIRPRKLILVAGEEEETLALAADCRKLIEAAAGDSAESGIDVFTPTMGITVDASVDTNAWTVKLSQQLVRRLRWQNVKGLGVVAITGRLEAVTEDSGDGDEGTTSNKKAKLSRSESQEGGEAGTAPMMPVLDVVPASMAAATRSVAQPLHVGDLRLADLRKIMQSSGFAAEFRGEGTLLINGSVVVRKSGTGRIEVESSGLGNPAGSRLAEGTFYAVKRKIYEGLAIVAGG